jgi:uncharacterized SAM-binding protein YcdF (DUF218 family)
MFFIISKVIFYLLMPITWVLASFLISFFSKNTLRKKKALRTGIVLLVIFSNSMFSNELLLLWEVPVTPFSEVKNYDVGIVLTGITNNNKEPYDRPYFNKGADRIVHAQMLYKMGKIKKILISGGVYFTDSRANEAKELQKFLISAGIPEKDIIVEDKSLNTHENALFSSEILQKNYPNQKYLLITSAFHLRRAKGCFEKAGVQTDTFATDFYSQQRSWLPSYWLIPTEKAFFHSFVVFHEVLGYVVYKAIGYA